MNWLGYIADVIGILGAIFALLGWQKAKELQKELQVELQREKKRQNEKVQIILQHGTTKIPLPGDFRRDELTRSEILGRIGMIPIKKEIDKGGGKPKRYSIESLGEPEFFKQIDQIIIGAGEGIMTISCTEEEIKQFKHGGK